MPMNQTIAAGGTTILFNRPKSVKIKCRTGSAFPCEVNIKQIHQADWIPLAAGESETFSSDGGIKSVNVRGVGGNATVDIYPTVL